MPHRKISDADGVAWDIWDVHPGPSDRRHLPDRRKESRDEPDRRREDDVGLLLQSAGSWLAFVSRSERRRLMLVPDGWEQLGEEDLQMLLVLAGDSSSPR